MFRNIMTNLQGLPPVNGNCPGAFYMGCENNGKQSYICEPDGFRTVQEACDSTNPQNQDQCPSMPAGSPVLCKGTPQPIPGTSPHPTP